MTIALYILTFILSFLMMEFIAWFTHKYIMHGFLWFLHKSHHEPRKGNFEWNDFFAVIFAIPSWLFIMLGVIYTNPYSILIGAGMTGYGIAYFAVHDVLVHQRLKLFKNLNGRYARAIRRAHKIHHKNLRKENGESFGFLFVEKKYFDQ